MNLESLFTNEEYAESRLDLGDGVGVSVLCLDSASTDHDLTGQIVWPVSVLLATFVARQNWKGMKCLEVGAGCGLCGFAASELARADTVAVTDGSDVVLDLLRRTVEELNKKGVVVTKLTWGDRESARSYVDRHSSPDVVLGADVVAWPQSIDPLLQTLKYIMSPPPPPSRQGAEPPVFYCGFVCRATSTRDLFYDRARRYGFLVETVDQSTFLPDPPPTQVAHSHQTLELLRLTLCRVSAPQSAPSDVFLSDDPEAYEATQTAC